jgi:thymidylate synthase
MIELFAIGETLPQVYHIALCELSENGYIEECPDYNQKQLECSMTMVVANPLAEKRISKLFIGGHEDLQQYVMEVLDGILDFKIGDGNAWEYTYHDRYIKQLPFIYEELKRNLYSRRAVINMRDFEIDRNNSHPACLQHMQFFIRENKLHMKILMRSNDAVKATFMNAFAFTCLQEKVANELGYEVGTYTHRANSFHCYEKDFPLLKQYINGIKEQQNIAYHYNDFYKELMEESIPNILKKVDQVKFNMEK